VTSATAQTATDISPFHVGTPEEKLAELRSRVTAYDNAGTKVAQRTLP
jgi:hypothetical protein